jgi:hypothetical protein
MAWQQHGNQQNRAIKADSPVVGKPTAGGIPRRRPAKFSRCPSLKPPPKPFIVRASGKESLIGQNYETLA